MKSVRFPVKNKLHGYRRAQKETNSVLWAKCLADLLIRESLKLPTVLWVTERETYTRDVDHTFYSNGKFTGGFTREIIILGSVRSGQNIEKVEVLVKIIISGRSELCTIALYNEQRFLSQAYVVGDEDPVRLLRS